MSVKDYQLDNLVSSQMLAVLLLASVIGLSAADTPAHCLYEDVRGTWIFYETERSGDNTINCDNLGPIVHVKNFTLAFPNTATDELGNAGTWTLIYNQGFEVGVAFVTEVAVVTGSTVLVGKLEEVDTGVKVSIKMILVLHLL